VGFARLIVPNAEFIVGSITDIPLPSRSVDAIASIQVIEHLPPEEVQKAIAEFARVLRDDGILVISVPSTTRPMSPAHFQHFTPTSIASTVETHFTTTRIVGQEYRSYALRILEKLVENRLWHLPGISLRLSRDWFPKYWNRTDASLGQNLVVVCEKKSCS
jgi:ubiquinone/menaquinone biosynthesis C-methylase UbiE